MLLQKFGKDFESASSEILNTEKVKSHRYFHVVANNLKCDRATPVFAMTHLHIIQPPVV